MPPPAATPAKASRPKSPSPPRIPGSGAPFVRSSFAPSPSQSMVSATRKTASYFVPDDDEEEMEIEVVEEPKAKKRKPSPPAPVVDEVIELDEEPKSALPAATPVNAKKNFPGMRDPYRSKEPSPLRQSFQPDSPPEFDTSKTSTTPAGSPKARAKQLPEAALPTFVFAALSSTADPFASTSTDATKEKALRAPLSDLPTFALDSTPAPTAAKASFDWSAAGMKPPAPKAGGAWICKECSLENPKDATEKCKFCDTKRPADAQLKGAAPAPAFNWAAAGFKMPEAPKGGAWKCGTCFCDNKAGATKCEVCDAPKS
ncbi:hypothetical protein EXIGLDRAFT_189767 [Exidia glandulosa HHB12029]|uniref:RanBP2-type domain-containing protein n=1 Tax=Exidia glandulosa HHB12029 TaxID=1314781 RepID=A0A165MZV7_EXIGL|nr:hypothetical protein EXIGLDRAFT_189767 [Exidia glandulosa HHB12029]